MTTKPIVKLTGTDGNAFAVMGAVSKAMRKVGWSEEEMRDVMNEMMSGDYDHLLSVACDVCEVE